MTVFRSALLAALGLAALTGCVDINYVGQTFPALPEGQEIAFFTPEIPVPEGEYHPIGRATLTAPGASNNETLREDLIESAREHGADAVQVIEFQRVQVGERSASENRAMGPNNVWDNNYRNPDGSYIFTNSFGEMTELEKPKRPVYETTIKALYLVTNARFKAETKEYGQELNAVEKQVETKLDAPVESGDPEAALGKLPPRDVRGQAVPPPVKAPEAPRHPTQVQLRNDSVAL